MACLCLHVWADESCRVAFDLGSSGLRGGASNSAVMAQFDRDFLALLGPGNDAQAAVKTTADALRDVMARGGFDPACHKVGGGFSAWRRALETQPVWLQEVLAGIHAASGVAVLVLPENVEGRYGYIGARQALADRLVTSHILDLGGGSLQIAGEGSGVGAMLGQKLWHQRLCEALRPGHDGLPCVLLPLSAAELQQARQLAADQLRTVTAALPPRLSLTAISRPVTRGIVPAVARLASTQGTAVLHRDALRVALGRLAGLNDDEMQDITSSVPPYARYLPSDMILVEGIMTQLGLESLQIAEVGLTNVAGLLQDDQAYRWGGDHYACYLTRLGRDGLGAYASDPATCPDSSVR